MRRKFWAGLAALPILSSCNFTPVGPKYIRPDVPAPPAFKEPPPEGWKNSQPNDAGSRGSWWEIYNDPQLNSFEEQVVLNNQNIQVAAANFRSARAAVMAARSALLPVVNGGGVLTGSQQSQNRFGGNFVNPTPFADIQFPITASWTADVWGRLRNIVQANVATAQATAGDLESALLSMQADVAVNYFLLRGSDAEKQLIDTTVSAYQRALELTTNRFNQGIASQVDVAQAQTQLESARAASTDTQVLRATYEHAIAVLIGKPPAEFSIAPNPLAMDLKPPVTPPELPSELLERRPDIASAERRVAAANAEIGVARAAYYPTVTLAASFGIETSDLLKLFTWPSRFWSVGPTLAQTLFEGGQRRAAVEQAQAAYDATAASYRQTVLTAFEAVENNLSTLRLLETEAASQALAVQAAERSLTLANNQYVGGITNYLQVITAQQAALGNESAAIQLLTRRMTASVNLVVALGGGWNASDLPPASSFKSVR
ncbi:MAG TPA: efflux transporter outer membrane subunit [Bryobacteraceae bacterium]|nr:efflux transporter outer membrane subunit [Bryobacteraceae bacterium]